MSLPKRDGTVAAAGHRTPVFPFIVGCGRSGTTLLRAMFDSNPEMAVPHESMFVPSMVRRSPIYDVDGGFDSDLFLRDLFEKGGKRLEYWNLEQSSIRRVLEVSPPADTAEAIRCVFAAYARREGKPRYGDKTPRYVFNVALLARTFPESRFIHIIRDGRDVALSMADVEWGPDNPAESAFDWKHRVQKARRAGRKLGTERYTEVRYEDLLTDPETRLRTLCAFVKLDFAPEMLHYFERSSEVVSQIVRPYRHTGIALPPTRGLRDWRKQMPLEDVHLFEVIAGDLLEELGYETHSKRPLGTRIQGHRTHLRLKTKLGLHRIRRDMRGLTGRGTGNPPRNTKS